MHQETNPLIADCGSCRGESVASLISQKSRNFLGSISDTAILLISLQRQGSKPSNFAIQVVLTSKIVKRSAFQNKRIAV